MLNYATIVLFQPLPAYYAKSICSILWCPYSWRDYNLIHSFHSTVVKVNDKEGEYHHMHT